MRGACSYRRVEKEEEEEEEEEKEEEMQGRSSANACFQQFPCQAGYEAQQRGFAGAAAAHHQGLTLVHLPAQRKRFLWARGCT